MTAQGAPAAALWLAGPTGEFLGSGFHLGAGRVVSCAHVVAGQPAVTARHSGAVHPARVVLLAPPERPPGAAVHPPPDLAVLDVPGLAGAPAVPLASRDVANGAGVLVHGFAVNALTGQVGPESAQLTVAGPSGLGLRVQLGWVQRGLSGSMAVDGNGRAVGVVKATADDRDPVGGWLTPVSELLPLVGEVRPAPVRPVTAMACTRLLVQIPQLDDPAVRRGVVQLMNNQLGPGAGIVVPHHENAFLHLQAIASSALNHSRPEDALPALLTSVLALCGPNRALDELGALLHLDLEE
ncbi:trypsin-like peptidase domain-containing protein [Kitasatospora sp. NPDC092948]|uniref:trypsin-like peptidase domain-containing protein n=1 Tax=Kitasatospora sp. NPDC092948 TaxID=3364088 RepID=UPI00380443A1